jgi:hypothetical protein
MKAERTCAYHHVLFQPTPSLSASHLRLAHCPRGCRAAIRSLIISQRGEGRRTRNVLHVDLGALQLLLQLGLQRLFPVRRAYSEPLGKPPAPCALPPWLPRRNSLAHHSPARSRQKVGRRREERGDAPETSCTSTLAPCSFSSNLAFPRGCRAAIRSLIIRPRVLVLDAPTRGSQADGRGTGAEGQVGGEAAGRQGRRAGRFGCVSPHERANCGAAATGAVRKAQVACRDARSRLKEYMVASRRTGNRR